MASHSGAPPSQSTPVVVEGRPIPDGSPLVSLHHSTPPTTIPDEPPPPPRVETGDEMWALPGWTRARHFKDGRIYYVEMATGRTSWVHPMANPNEATGHGDTSGSVFSNNTPWATPNDDGMWNTMLDTPLTATRRPDSHQCCAFVALIVFFPFGLCAKYHSLRVDKMWKPGRYGDAVNHSRQASKYGTFGVVLGSILLLIFVMSRREGRWEWPRFDVDWFD